MTELAIDLCQVRWGPMWAYDFDTARPCENAAEIAQGCHCATCNYTQRDLYCSRCWDEAKRLDSGLDRSDVWVCAECDGALRFSEPIQLRSAVAS